MKLKDLTPKGQKAINEVDLPMDRMGMSNVDHTTMKLKSNIDQKWGHITDMTRDLEQWMEASYHSSGPEILEDIEDALEGLLEKVKYLDSSFGND